MGFWIFMFMMDLLIPLTMIGFGKGFLKAVPREINAIYGYRTAMSMKNRDTWTFAHNYYGKLWYRGGVVLLPISVMVMLLVIGKSEDMIGTVGGILCGMQMVPLLLPIIFTEKALKRTFDKEGNRREK